MTREFHFNPAAVHTLTNIKMLIGLQCLHNDSSSGGGGGGGISSSSNGPMRELRVNVIE